MIYKQFYSELGKLLYALADVDGVISKKEKKALHEIIHSELVPAEENRDEFGTDAAFYTEFEFDILEDAKPEPEAAFESFVNFIENHKTAIDIKKFMIIKRIAEKLAESYHHTSKKEKELINKLDRKIDELVKEKQLLSNK